MKLYSIDFKKTTKFYGVIAIGLSIIILLACGRKDQETAKAPDYPIQPVPFTAVKLTDNFWAPRIRLNHDVTIPIALDQCYKTGRVDNFLIAAKMKTGRFCTEYPFDDSDLYKIIEGASYSIQTFPDKNLEARIDSLIEFISKAQESDGYLFTNRTIDSTHLHPWVGKKRWEKDPELSHELYNSGHLFEAAVAHFQATGKRSLLDVAIKNADLLVKEFGPGKLAYEPGHQVVEMGLVKMYRITGKKEYLDLAKYFLDIRGKGQEYSQDHMKVTEQTKAVGHAVRAMYMYSGMADVAAIKGDSAYLKALDQIWNNLVFNKFYITGGIGAAAGHEGFGAEYELPNAEAYNETCASIGEVYWNSRMFWLKGESDYYDVLERILYNGLISGVSLSGNRFFYPNPLASKGQYERSEWFGCACCPSNVCRFIPSVPGYVYATQKNKVYVNLYIGNTAQFNVEEQILKIEQKTEYPWQGKIELTVTTQNEQKIDLALRIPGWSQNKPVPGDLYHFVKNNAPEIQISVNGKKTKYIMEKGYAIISRKWKAGDKIILDLPMPVQLVAAHEKVSADSGRVALQRGPIVYCGEWPDFSGGKVLDYVLNPDASFTAEYKPGLLSGVTVITDPQGLTAIPYYAWANRGQGEMNVWFGQKKP